MTILNKEFYSIRLQNKRKRSFGSTDMTVSFKIDEPKGNQKSRKMLIKIGSEILKQANFIFGDRIEIFMAKDDSTLLLGTSTDGWKLIPYGISGDDYSEAMGGLVGGVSGLVSFSFSKNLKNFPKGRYPLFTMIPKSHFEIGDKQLGIDLSFLNDEYV